jgi:hypothetical protein
MHTPIPKPGYGHATAKFAIDFGDCTASGYLFTNGIAPEGFVIPGTAWTGGEIAIAPAPGGERAELFPSGRARWLSAIRDARVKAGYPAEFDSGQVIVHANPGHGTGEAEAAFDEPGTVLAALEDAMSAAGWTLVTARPEITPPAAETAGDIPALLRQLARAIDDTLGTESA